MAFVFNPDLICPLDQQPLMLDGHACRCANGHGFDVAKQGYVNLLPVQQKKSLHPGDSRDMVKARSAFLNAGFYAPIADQLRALVADVESILDAGCGDGYYTQYLKQHLGRAVSITGLDISKDAILAAAKRKQEITWLVASNKSIPLADESIDVIVCAFGFPVWSEFKRLLKPNGRVILLESAENHLLALRTIIYDDVVIKSPPKLTDADLHGFKLVKTKNIHEQMQVPPQYLESLLMMTPHGYRIAEEKKQAVLDLAQLDCEIDVLCRVLQRVG